jgi:hypothetical protein
MKHLRKYNESVDIEDIKDIFLDLTDINGIEFTTEVLKDDFSPGLSSNSGSGCRVEGTVVGYIFRISIINPVLGTGNPYSSHEVEIAELENGISKFSDKISKSKDIILEALQRVKDAGFKITYYAFSPRVEPQCTQISFAVSIL